MGLLSQQLLVHLPLLIFHGQGAGLLLQRRLLPQECLQNKQKSLLYTARYLLFYANRKARYRIYSKEIRLGIVYFEGNSDDKT